MSTVRHDFRLSFLTNLGNNMRFNIARANPGATDTQLQEAMAAMIASGVVRSTAGNPITASGVELITTETTEIIG